MLTDTLADELVHYWPFSGTLKDVIGNKNINSVENLTEDKYGNKDSGKWNFFLYYVKWPISSYTFDIKKAFYGMIAVYVFFKK